ncbi:hypothetical protein [Hymenobacter cellulosilyticus]|uniref:Uncharacterized protein n=1 Tax=Hymenobacter cellulosilyticus TaxID=2932248 RepID=A0A8T9Q9Q8_9BACT|nr:hypothetical protein [Hymenobacter cellulosilyticus]UOQ71663.1 hypothetical protein MUN79_24130 [Hymenobacter cellulosilyticus]
MKNPYLSALQWVQKPHWRFLLLLLLALPFLGQAQTLTVSPTTTPTSPDEYGSVAVGAVSNPAKQYTVTATDLVGTISVNLATAPSFEASVNGTDYSTNISLPATGGTFFVRFRPTTVGTTTVDPSNGRIIVTGTDAFFGNISRNIFVRGTGTPGTPTIDVTPDARIFTPTVVNTTSAPQAVAVTASSLTGPITVTAPNGYQVSNANVNGGAYATTLQLQQTDGGNVNTTVNIRFAPTQAIAYNNVSVTFASPGAATKSVAVSGTGTLPPPS